VADYRTSIAYSVANGGHWGYGGNEVDALKLETENPQWVEVLASTSNADIIVDSPYYADGRPTATHTYYGVWLNEFEDRLMFNGEPWYGDPGTDLYTLNSYNIGSNSYSPAGTHPNVPFRGYGSSYTLDPATGDAYVTWNGQMSRWNRNSNTWTSLGATGTVPGGGQQSAFDSTRRRILIVGSNPYGGVDNGYYTVASNSWTSNVLTGSVASAILSRQQGGMFYVPALDKYLVRFVDAGGTVYQIDASTFESTTFPTNGGSSIPTSGSATGPNGPYNKFLYLPRLGGAVYIPTYAGNAWFLRLH
jgi:hypothetical protein